MGYQKKEKENLTRLKLLEHCFKIFKSKIYNVQVELLSASRLLEL